MSDAMNQEQLEQWLNQHCKMPCEMYSNNPAIYMSALLGLFAGRRLVQAGDSDGCLADENARLKSEIEGMNDAIESVNALCRARDDAFAEIDALRETLRGIAEADYRKWEEFASPEEFVRWAKSRANHALSRTAPTEALQPASPDVLLMPRDPVALLTSEMKAEHIGEYLMDIQVNCEECDREGCDACNHLGRVTWSPAIPWATCKQIFKAMYTTAVKAAEVKP